MRNLFCIAAIVIGHAIPSAAQSPATVSLDQALAISMDIAQAWPGDISSLRDVMQGDRFVSWMDMDALRGAPLVGIASNDPWYGSTNELGMDQPIGLTCIRTGQVRLTEMRAINAMITDPGGVDVEAVVARENAMVPPTHEMESYAVLMEWANVPPEALAAQFCVLNFPVAQDFTRTIPEGFEGQFDTIAPEPPGQREPFGLVPPFDDGTIATGWRGQGPSGGITLLWSGPMVSQIENIDMMFVMVTSWLAPAGS